MRTEINKKPGRPSERSEEARAKGAKRGNNRWGVGGGGEGAVSPPPPQWGTGGGAPEKLAFLRFVIIKNAISLQEMQDIPNSSPSPTILILLHKIHANKTFNTNKKIHTKLK